MTVSRVLLAFLPLGALTACAPGNCDPAQADFFTGIAGQASGCYAARNQTLQTNLQSARTDLQRQQSLARAAAIDKGAAEAERDRAATRLHAMGNDMAHLRQLLNDASRREHVDRVALQRQQSDLESLERDRRTAMSRPADPAEVQELERRRKALLDSATSD